jgi:C1A family cysteine protease
MSITRRQTKWYGWHPDLPDQRDMLFAAPQMTKKMPLTQINSHFMPEVWNQGNAGSCTGQSTRCSCKYDLQRQQAKVIFTPSALFIYYNARLVEGTTGQDAGAQIRDVIKGIARYGFCDETTWPYDVNKVTVKPTKKCYTEGAEHLALKYSRVPQTLSHLKSCIASGYTFVFGFTVYDSFESDAVSKTGILPMPGPNEAMVGGHAVCCFGYDDTYVFPWGAKGAFYIRNSWGEDWGQYGNFLMPYDYMLNPDLTADHWNVQFVKAA